MDPNAVIAGSKFVLGALSTVGVARIMGSVAKAYSPTNTIINKILVNAGAWGMALVVNEQVAPAVDRKVDEIATAIQNSNIKLVTPTSPTEK